MTRANVQHSSESVEWFTPRAIVDAARAVLGRIDLDPASCAEANATVGASRFLTRRENGLEHPWFGNVFVNPPGGTALEPGGFSKKPASSARLFWEHLQREIVAGRCEHAVFLAFSLELLQRTQGRPSPSCADFPLVVLAQRPRYVAAGGKAGTQPTHASAVVYVPGRTNRTRAFVEAFAALGAPLLPVGWM